MVGTIDTVGTTGAMNMHATVDTSGMTDTTDTDGAIATNVTSRGAGSRPPG